MSNKQKVCIEFINKKGVLKKGSFYMDKKTYEILFAIRTKIDIPGLFRKSLVMMTYGISQADAYGECTLGSISRIYQFM